MIAKTNTERVQALRKRLKEAGLSEVRGIWASAALHVEVREQAEKLIRRREKATQQAKD